MQRNLRGFLGSFVGIKRTVLTPGPLNVGRPTHDSINMHRGGKVYRVKQLREQLNQADENILQSLL